MIHNLITKLFRKVKPPLCSIGRADHKWINVAETQHFWDLYTDGSSKGQYGLLTDRLEWEKKNSVRKQCLEWIKKGFNAYHTNLLWWQCSECKCSGGFTEKYIPFYMSKERQNEGNKAMKEVIKMVC